ncbi:SGNH hydrolase [Paraphaeosphaeria sporulosa]|uniref:SGNH hydrolase n=1 Tax=Paraphaeosphaeria sporulosa TaxID=1460663 RepID=A0A177C407_9PLEO|nr:SGNH hydrolase [Paraphaeosphaeria sporulosa]OAG01528.1 SGNH hydrolase [Paraphaeosphaeria sporulosa]
MSTTTPQTSSVVPELPNNDNTHRAVYPQFIFFGDSITQIDGNPSLGFSCVGSLRYDYTRRIDIIARGFAGYNTSDALNVLPKFFPQPQEARVRLVTIFFGANDACLPHTTGQHISLEHFKLNLHKLLSHPCIIAHRDVKVLLITPPPVDEWQFDDWEEPAKSARKAVIAQAYARAVVEVGAESETAVVDLWGACMREVGWDGGEQVPGDRGLGRSDLRKLLVDGLHLSGEGYTILCEEMKMVIAREYPELVPEKIPFAL